MVKKVIRGIIWLTGILLVLLAIAVAAAYYYLNANHDRVIRETAQAAGLVVSYQKLDFEVWRDFPRVSLYIDSLVVRDTLVSRLEPPLLSFGTIRAEASLAALLRDTLHFKCLELGHGNIHIVRDSSGRYNLGSIFVEKPDQNNGTAASFLPELGWEGLQVDFVDVGIYHRDPLKQRLIELQANEVYGYGTRNERGELELNAQMDLDVGGVALNTEKGSYLRNTPVKGPVKASFGKEIVSIPSTELQFGAQLLTVSASFSRNTKGEGEVHISGTDIDYDITRPLLHDALQEKLANYHVTGTFPAAATVALLPEEPHHPEITVDFRLDGQSIRLLQYKFNDVHTTVNVVNRLKVAEGGLEDSPKNLRISLGETRGMLGPILVQAPHALVASIEGDSRLEAPLQLSGPSAALSARLQNRSFFFRNGRFKLTTAVNAWLSSEDELIASSDGLLELKNVDVNYQPAGASFPFASIELKKTGQDIGFRVASQPLSTGLSFALEGSIDNLTPLLLDRPGEALNTDVKLSAPRIDWTDFLSFFGEEGYFYTTDENKLAPQASMRKTLLGLKATFHPTVDVTIDTLAYYDVLTINAFNTGLHFSKDTLVLEETTFDWAGSQLGLSAKLDLLPAGYTPFNLAVEAEHLNLNRLRPALNYFGLKLPAELDSLPEDLSIRYAHRGRLNDTTGIVSGYNTGNLIFNDGRNQLFAGEVAYAPGPNGLETRIQLNGDPQLVNTLFNAENFFFGTGHFNLDIGTTGTPENLQQLIKNGTLKLRIDSSRIAYSPAGVYVPIRFFDVNFQDDRADYRLQLLTDTTLHPINIEGELEDLTAFLFPAPERSFKVRADLNARRLNWSDFNGFFLPDSSAVADTTAFDPQSVFSATEGIFSSFRPDVKLAIDTLFVGPKVSLTNIFSRLRMQDSAGLVLERSGFDVGEGQVRFNAAYGLDESEHSPFFADWTVDTLNLELFLAELENMGVSIPADPGLVRGKITMQGSVRGELDEANQHIMSDHTSGEISYELSELEIAESPFLRAIGKKAKMRKRFEHLQFAPLTVNLTIDSGRVNIPRTEVQSTGFQVFIEGDYHVEEGPDLLISLPLRNIGRGLLSLPPDTTGYARAGWKVYLVAEPGKDGEPKMKFRLGRRRYFKERGRLEEFKAEKQRLKAERKKRN